MRDFHSLTEKEVLTPAISLEEEDERIYTDFGERLWENLPGTAKVFEEMRQEEVEHRRRLIELLATITWVRHRFMETPPLSAAMQVALGGALVFATGILIGSS